MKLGQLFRSVPIQFIAVGSVLVLVCALTIFIATPPRPESDLAKELEGHFHATLKYDDEGYIRLVGGFYWTDAEFREALPLLIKCKRLKELMFSPSQIGDDSLAELGRLPNIKSFDLGSTGEITEKGLRHLQSLHELEDLNLEQIAPAGSLQFVRSLTKMRTLRLSSSRVTDDDLAELKELTDLRLLELAGCDVTDKGLSVLENFPQLRYLDLRNTQITTKTLKRLIALRHLEELLLERTNLTDDDLKYVGRISSLRKLFISFNRDITDDGISELGGLKRLSELSVLETQVSIEGLKKLQRQLPNIEDINSSGLTISK